THPEYLSPDYLYFEELLASFYRHKVTLNHELLLQWVTHFQSIQLDLNIGRAYLEVLIFLHQHDSEKAEQLLLGLINDDIKISKDAAETLLRVRDLPHPCFLLADWEDKAGLEALSLEEQTVRLVYEYVYRMSCGGLSALEYNVDDGHLPLMEEALLRIGAEKSASRLREYLALYGPSGPAVSTAEQAKQIKSYGDRWSQDVEAIRDKYQTLEDVTLLALKYQILNASAFKSASKIRELLK
ncbi:MAG: DMP19 family protein, partial [Prosthecobacter sp.]|nr:DMP19 family protein [Prosthecobacter sp.]